jgi:hypothetical protein
VVTLEVTVLAVESHLKYLITKLLIISLPCNGLLKQRNINKMLADNVHVYKVTIHLEPNTMYSS